MLGIMMVFFGMISYKIVYLVSNLYYSGEKCNTDMSIHLEWAKELFSDGFGKIFAHSSYPLWDLLVNIMHRFFVEDWNAAAAIGTALIYVFIFLVFFWYINKETKGAFVFAVIGAAYLMVVQPVTRAGLTFANEQRIQLITTWHNPTNVWPRLFAIPIIFLFFDILLEKQQNEKELGKYMSFGGLLVLVNLGKPSFSQVFLPTIAIFCLIMCIYTRFQCFRTCVKLAIACVPSFALLLFQMSANFYGMDNSGGVEIAWYKVLSLTQRGNPQVVVEAIAFPLVFSILYLKKEYKNPKFLFMWLFYAISFLEFALLAEKGDRAYHGNFGWGYIVAILLLHAYMLTELYKNGKEKRDWRVWGCAILILLHFICGISWMYWQTTEIGALTQNGVI
jgi:hypothetical protein